jgi:DNA mismatch repair protein MutL
MKNNTEHIGKHWIRPLPERLVNKIAAGEVIERPAAVLKELVENSFDAGADRIDITVEKSGTRLITIIDNGRGIPADQVEVAFSRHATSKISDFNDLEQLLTFGFRGEALPSIASVAKTRMITRTVDEDTGTVIIIEGGVLQSVKPTAAPVGTTVEVRDLFFNTPARRKFLKTELTEARYLNRNAVALALSAPRVAISYQINGRRLFSLDKNINSIKSRVAHLLANGDDRDLVEIDGRSDSLEISGCLTLPGRARQNRYGLYLFVNGRFISSPSILHAVISGYGELLPRGNYPLGAVFLEVDPLKVDVNVHPTKAEVRLSDEKLIHDFLYQVVKRTLRGTDDMPLHHPDQPKTGTEATKTMSAAEAVRRMKNYSPPVDFKSVQTDLEKLYQKPDQTDSSVSQTADRRTDTIQPVSPESPMEKPGEYIYLGQLAGLYLLFKTENRLIIIDQHTAHERVLYETNMRCITEHMAVSQNLLFPINIDLSADFYALYEEAAETLNAAGFEVRPFGARTVIITAVPTDLSKKSPEKIFQEILADVENLKEAGFDLRKAVAQSLACRAAVMAGDRMTEKEAHALLKQLLKCENYHCCPHGRPTIINLTKEELDTKFGR